jgi:hypothetical protein
VDNPTPFVGQQIVYRFRFYQAVNLFVQPRLDWPTFSGFLTESLVPNNISELDAAGRRYRVTEVRQALFPTISGQLAIEPTTLTIPGDFLSRDTVLTTEPVVVDVQPLPNGAPDGFTGAVGQFQITAWTEPQQAQANEPLTLLVRISGTGDLTTLADPTSILKDLLPDWRVYDAKTTTNVTQDGDIVRGEKLFERLLVPRTNGDHPIPSFTLIFFDPQTGEYRRTETEDLVVAVTGSDNGGSGTLRQGNTKQDITIEASDIRHIKPALPSLATQRTSVFEQPVYWAGWIAPIFVLVAVWAWDQRRRRLAGDTAYARAQRARRQAHKQLAQAQGLASDDRDAAYSAVAHALTNYLGDKFDLPASSLTRDSIRQAMTMKTVPGDLVDRFLTCLDWADSGRFAPMAAGREIEDLIAEAEVVIMELEQTIRYATTAEHNEEN